MGINNKEALNPLNLCAGYKLSESLGKERPYTMKYISLIVVVIVMLLFLTSCGCEKPSDINSDLDGTNKEDLTKTDDGGLTEDFANGVIDSGTPNFTDEYLDLCYDAISVADEYIAGDSDSNTIIGQLNVIYNEMGDALDNPKNNTGSGAMCRNLIGELSSQVSSDDSESMELFISTRNMLAEKIGM